MRKNLLKMSLIAIGMVVGTMGAWADEVTTSYDFEDGNKVFTADSRISVNIEDDENLNSKVVAFTCANNAQNAYSFAHYDFSSLVDGASTVSISFDYWNTKDGRCFVSIGDAIARGKTGGSSKVTYNGGGALFRIGSDKYNFYVDNKKYALENYCNQWLKVKVVVDVINEKVSYRIANSNDVELLSEADVAYYNSASSCTQIDVFGYINNSKMAKIDNLTITSKKDIKSAVFTIKRICNDEEIDSKKGSGLIGTMPELDAEDKENFFNSDKTKKYIYVSDDASSQTIAEDGSTVVTVQYREANTYNYTVNAVDESGNELGEIKKGSAIEGENVTVAYSTYINKDGELLQADKIDDKERQYNYTFNVSADNIVKTITYKATIIKDVVYYSEAENIDGLTIVNTGNSAIRSSNSASAYAKDGDVVFTTLPAGLYKLTTVVCDFKGRTPSAQFSFKAGEDIIFTFAAEHINWSQGSSDIITLRKPTEISLAQGGNSKQAVDFIYIQKVPSEAVSVSAAEYATYATKGNIVAPSDVKLYTVKVNEAGTAIEKTAIAAGTVIPAGTGILVNGAEGSYDFAVTSDEAATMENNDLVAATADVASDGATYYALAKKNGKVGFSLVAEGVVIPAGKAYLKVSEASGAKFISMDGELTGIDNVKTEAASERDAYYTLQGLKTAKPAKGLYIHNGKTVIIK